MGLLLHESELGYVPASSLRKEDALVLATRTGLYDCPITSITPSDVIVIVRFRILAGVEIKSDVGQTIRVSWNGSEAIIEGETQPGTDEIVIIKRREELQKQSLSTEPGLKKEETAVS